MHKPDPLDDLRRDRAALEAELQAAGLIRKGKNWQCPDPSHPDLHPSASMYQDDGGAWRVKCHSCGWCGDVFDVEAATKGVSVAEVLRYARQALTPPKAAQTTPTPDMTAIAKRYYKAITDAQRQALGDELGISTTALERLRLGWCQRDGAYSFPMRDHTGRVVGIRLRSGDKKYAETGSDGSGLFIPANLAGGDVLAICEGPTDAAALLDIGQDAIGRPNNCGTTAEDYIVRWLTAHPYRLVWIVTDNDPAGSAARDATQAAAQRLAKRLVSVCGSVRVFAPPDPHKDIRQWRQAGADLDDLQAVADNAEKRGPAADLLKVFEAEIDGTRQAIPLPWHLVSLGTQALLPGAVTLIVGEGGAGKTYLKHQLAAHLHDSGVPIAIFELEEDTSYHLRRMLAQRVGASWLTDIEQVKKRPADVRAYQAEHSEWQDGIGRLIDDAPNLPVSMDDLIAWVGMKCKAGARVLFIDPVTGATTSERPWDDAQKFLFTVGPMLNQYGASLVLVSHPKKGRNNTSISTLDDLAGGAAWVRFSQTVLWLEHHKDPKSVTVRRHADPLSEVAEITRTLRILKARNGRGGNWALAYELEPGTLRFNELGAIVKTEAQSATDY